MNRSLSELFLSSMLFRQTGVPAAPEDIREAEELLSLRFSPEYAAYLAAWGGAAFGDHSLTGLGTADDLDVVTATLEARLFHSAVPSSWYAIERVGSQGIVVWQDFTGTVYWSQPGRAPYPLCSSLAVYLEPAES